MRYLDGNDFKEQNGYVVRDNWYPRVTRILEIKSKPGLESFFREVGSFESAEEVKTKSAAHGSLVHETVQKLAVGEKIAIPEKIRAATEAFLEFNKERPIHFHPEFIERQVWSEFHRYAGTVDALASIDGKFGVLDIKTSTGMYPEYNLQTAAYVQALQENSVKEAMSLPHNIETRWILRIDQYQVCRACSAKLREKGGWVKVRLSRKKSNGKGKYSGLIPCPDGEHDWADMEGEVELREFPYYYNDMKAFNAAKTLWEWENSYWLRQIGYSR
ncbi:MAG TPA: hypothetical protein VJB56_00075 [Candidatus Paceibacterota bacterium]